MSFNKTNKIQIVKNAPPPTDLPTLGKEDQENVCFIGRTNYVAALEEKKYVFGIKREDRKRHIYIIGKSGVGKTKIEELMMRQDIAYGHGICLIDSNGELIEEILNFIPENRIDDVCLIDPRDINFPVSFNPFSNIDPIFKNQFVSCFIEILKKQFNENWNNKIEHISRFSILALIDYPSSNMNDLIRIIKDKDFRSDVSKYIKDDMVKSFWDNEFDDWNLKYDNDVIIPFLNRLGQFLYDPIMRGIFNQKNNKIDLNNLIENKKIILLNLSKGEIGDSDASFFGSIFLMKLKQAGMIRSRFDQKDHNDFYVYIDEFQNVANDTLISILSESRKYNFCFTLVHQYLAQLDNKTEQFVIGNVGTLISFRIGGEDAVKLKPEFAPIFDVKDMINLGVGEFYIKMVIDGESYDPFSADALRVLSPTHKSFRQKILELSRNKYSVSIK